MTFAKIAFWDSPFFRALRWWRWARQSFAAAVHRCIKNRHADISGNRRPLKFGTGRKRRGGSKTKRRFRKQRPSPASLCWEPRWTERRGWRMWTLFERPDETPYPVSRLWKRAGSWQRQWPTTARRKAKAQKSFEKQTAWYHMQKERPDSTKSLEQAW